MEEINKHLEQIKKLCASNGVKSLFVFGSVLKNQLSLDSDIDFVVDIEDMDPLTYSDKYFNLKFKLEKIFNRKIDLLELKALKNSFLLEEIKRTQLQVYAA